MSSALDYLRVEVSTSPPLSVTQAWRDVTPRCRLEAGVSINRGRPDEWSPAQPGRCTLTLDNEDGALTPLTGSLAVKPGCGLRVSWRDPAPGNLVDAESAAFEGGTVGSWSSTWLGAPAAVTLASDATQSWQGTRSMRISWPTAAAGCSPQLYVSGLVLGRTYTAHARIWVSAGDPSVRWGDLFGLTPTVTTTTTSQWQLRSITWTATSSAIFLGVRSTTATTSGQQVWVDGVMVDEGAAAGAFTTAPPVVRYRFSGFVDEWPVQWPTGGDNYSSVSVTAVDLMARLGRMPELASVIEETVRRDGPRFYFPLAEEEGATTVADATGSAASLAVKRVGSGGLLTFGSATGPPTDGRSAPQFVPRSPTSGYYLTGTVDGLGGWYGAISLEVALLTSATVDQSALSLRDIYGSSVRIGTTAAGKARVTVTDVWSGSTWSATSTATVADGVHHHVAVTLGYSAGVATLTLYVDGAADGSVSIPGVWITGTLLDVGGTSVGSMFSGTLSHVAGYLSVLSGATLSAHYSAITSGYSGEGVAARQERVLGWAGVPSALYSLDTTDGLVGHADCTGWTPLEYLQRLAMTEGGPLFVDTAGVLRQHSRSRIYGAIPALSVAADSVDPDSLTMTLGLDGLANSVAVTRHRGPTQRVSSAASITAYGLEGVDLEVLSLTDADALNAAGWRLSRGSEPVLTTPQVGLDPLTDTTHTSAILDLDVGSVLSLTGLPSQAPSSAASLVVQGYSEYIGIGGWSVVLTTTTRPYVLILDDATYGPLDSYPLAY